MSIFDESFTPPPSIIEPPKFVVHHIPDSSEKSVSLATSTGVAGWRPRISIGSRVVIETARIVELEFGGRFFEPSLLSTCGFSCVGEVVQCTSRFIRVRFVQAAVPGGLQLTGSKGESNGSHSSAGIESLLGKFLSPKSKDNGHFISTNHTVFSNLLDAGITMGSTYTFPAKCVVSLLEFILQQSNLFHELREFIERHNIEGALALLGGITAYLGNEQNLTPGGAPQPPKRQPDPKVTPICSSFQDTVDNAEQRHISFLLLASVAMHSSTKTLPELAVVHSFRSILAMSIGKLDEAFDAARQALRQDPSSIEAYTAAASVLLAMDRIDEAQLVVDACRNQRASLSSEFEHIALSIRVARYYQPVCRNFGIDILPASLDEVLRAVKQFSVPAQKAAQAIAHTAISPAALSECLSRPEWGNQPRPSWQTVSSTPLMSSQLLRCISTVKRSPALDSKRQSVAFTDRVSALLPSLTALKSQRVTCGYCGFSLTAKTQLIQEVSQFSKLLADIVRRKYPSRDVFPCEGGCGLKFCGEVCRSKAYLEFHELECALPCRWRTASPAARTGDRRVSIAHPTPPTRYFFPTPPTAGMSAAMLRRSSDVVFMTENLESPHKESSGSPTEEMTNSVTSNPFHRNSTTSLEPVSPFSRTSAPPRTPQAAARVNLARRNSATAGATNEAIALIRDAARMLADDVLAPQGTFYRSPASIRNALLLFSRVVTTMLSLFFPPTSVWEGEGRFQRVRAAAEKDLGHEKASIIKVIIENCEARGLSAKEGRSNPDRHDTCGVMLAEEVLHCIGIPFFADTASFMPLKWHEVEAPEMENKTSLRKSSLAAAVHDTAADHVPAQERAFRFLTRIHVEVIDRFSNQTVALSSTQVAADNSDNSARGTVSPISPALFSRRASTVWTLDEDGGVYGIDDEPPNIWTVGRILSFLQSRRFSDQLWNLCAASHVIIPRSPVAAVVGPHIPKHLQSLWNDFCRKHLDHHVVLAPTTALCSDLISSGGEVTSRFHWIADLHKSSSLPSIAELRNSGMLSLCSQCSSDDASRDNSQLSDTEGIEGISSNSLQLSSFQAQAEAGGNVYFDPLDEAMCIPGRRGITIRPLAEITPGETLRLVVIV